MSPAGCLAPAGLARFHVTWWVGEWALHLDDLRASPIAYLFLRKMINTRPWDKKPPLLRWILSRKAPAMRKHHGPDSVMPSRLMPTLRHLRSCARYKRDLCEISCMDYEGTTMDGSPSAVAGSSAQSPSAAEIPAAPPSPAAEAAEALLAAATAENLTAGPSPAAEAADWGLTAAAALLRDAAAAEHNNLTVGVYEEIYRHSPRPRVRVPTLHRAGHGGTLGWCGAMARSPL